MKFTRANFLFVFLLLSALNVSANPKDPNIFYVSQGKSVNPWKASLAFEKSSIKDGKASTIRKSLVLKESDEGFFNLKWHPKKIKNEWGGIDTNILTFNLINKLMHANVQSVKQQAAIMLELRINRPPKELVNFTLECDWNWECRDAYPLKQILRNAPTDEWVSIPIPLSCFNESKIDLSKLTGMMISTIGKLDMDIRAINLVSISEQVQGC